VSCVNYNIVKEGNLRNLVSGEVSLLTSSGIQALYDGDVSSVAVTISGAPLTVGLLAEFGEAYDVCYVEYYTSETDINNIQISYGTTSGTLTPSLLTLESAGHYRATLNTSTHFVELRHTVSGISTDLKQFEIIATKNETLGFGSSLVEEVDSFHLPHATVDVLSASANEIPLFNDNHFDELAQVAIAPTFTEADDYLFLSTSLSGVYYGLNDFGFQQPGPNPPSLQDDSMQATSINPQWERFVKAHQHTITATEESLVFDIGYKLGVQGSSTSETVGIISKDSFTAGSFTAEVEIKFTQVDTSNDFGLVGRDFFFVLTNGFPIPDVGYKGGFLGDNRRGYSTGGVAMRAVSTPSDTDSFTTMFRYADGQHSDNPFSMDVENLFTGGEGAGNIFLPVTGDTDELGNYTLSDVEDIVNGGAALNDLTASAPWHKWRISYNHVTQELSGWTDHIFLGSRVFSLDLFGEACHLFLGHHGDGGVRWETRNFKFLPDKLYQQRKVSSAANGGVATATVSGVADNVGNLIDDSDATAYVGPDPTANATIRLTFDGSQDVTYYTIKQRDQGTATVSGGVTYYPDVVRTSIVDMGGVRQEIHLFPNSDAVVPRAPTFSGTAVTASGIDYIEWQLASFDRTGQPDNAVVIEELAVYAEEYVDIVPETINPFKAPWVEGHWRNLKQDVAGNLVLRDKVSPEAAYWPFPEHMKAGVDFGFSSAVNGRQFFQTEDYHHTETIFAAPGSSGDGSYVGWQSEPQGGNAPFFLWRKFEASCTVAALLFDSRGPTYDRVADSFKVQYLREGGDPTVELDWVNIPPVTEAYTSLINDGDTLYKRYKDYLIANNDGEYYTDYDLLPLDTEGSSTGFGVGTSFSLAPLVSSSPLPANSGYTSLHVPTGATSNNTAAYIEFDTPVVTRGVRLVVKNPVIGTGLNPGYDPVADGVTANEFSLGSFRVIRNNALGVYTSPVFDTGTKQNTERVFSKTQVPTGTSVSTFVRSSDQAPSYKYDYRYETWEARGRLGKSPFNPGIQPALHNRAVVVADKVYFLMSSAPYVYNVESDLWSQENGGFPTTSTIDPPIFEDDGLGVSTSPDIIPDDRVADNACYLDGVIYVAAYDSGDVRNPRFLKLDLSEEVPNWKAISENRPPDTEYATMAGYDGKLYFFNRTGSVFYYDIALANWIQASSSFPVFGGSREYMSSVVYQDKIYLFGGYLAGQVNVSIFDPAVNSFSSGQNSPKEMLRPQAVLVAEEKVVYILPTDFRVEYNENSAAMKYYIEEDRWEFAEGMMWNRDRVSDSLSTALSVGKFYFKQGTHIYRVNDSDNGLARSFVVRDTWNQAQLPDLQDGAWGGSSLFSGIPWEPLDSFGEMLPQDRYFQFKVELSSDDRVTSPTLEGVNVVLPQEIVVPASGTASVFMKVGASVTSGTSITTGKLKVHNKGAAL